MKLFSLQTHQVVAEPDDPLQALERQEMHDLLDRELATLSHGEEEALRWKAGLEEGVTCRQIARRHRVCHETVRNWAETAIIKLRARLEGLL